MKVSRILHAGYIFESGDVRIVFDPIFENPFSRNCYAYPNVNFDFNQIQKLKLDAIFISHHHDDHFSLESLKHLDRETPIYMYCAHSDSFQLLHQLGFRKIQKLIVDSRILIGPFQITPRLALDSDVDCLFQIQGEGLNILNVVDAWIDPAAMDELARFRWDLVLWPFQTIREIEVIAPELAQPAEFPKEWLEQIRILNPRCIVPSSCQFIHEEWSWYRKVYFPISYDYFRQEIQKLLKVVVVQRMNPGISIEIGKSEIKLGESLPWIFPRGEQSIDYEYDPAYLPTAMAEIARNFSCLSQAQEQRVFHFCEIELIQRYNELDRNLNGSWRLMLYNCKGGVVNFQYEIINGVILRSEHSIITKWITEVPLTKVYFALEEGETLTSMYLRMYGMPFENIGEDPLIATLFTEEFGAYQKAQLKKITSSDDSDST